MQDIENNYILALVVSKGYSDCQPWYIEGSAGVFPTYINVQLYPELGVICVI